MIRSVSISICGFIALAGCTVGPDYAAPEIKVPPSYANAAARSGENQVDASVVAIAQWWTRFDDPVLDGLVEQALASNIDVQIAASRISEARYRLDSARANSLPLVGASAAVNNTRISENSGLSSLASSFGGGTGSSSSGLGLPGTDFSTLSAGFDASWEADLFGGSRRAREAARGDLEAAIWSERDSQVRLSAEVARTYFSLRNTQAQLIAAETLLTLRHKMHDIVSAQANSGVLPGKAIQQPAAMVDQAEVQIAQLQGEERELLAALALLLGGSVQELPPGLIDKRTDPVVTDLVIPAGLPSELLLRRPDVRAAERKLAAATARIGVAKANSFPTLSLTGVAELISSGLSNLISSNSIETVAQGKVAVPIFDFGRGRAATGAASEQANQADLAYQQAILSALTDVEQALSRVAAERERNQLLQDNLRRMRMIEAAEESNFRTGLTDFTPVGQAVESTIAAHQNLLDSDFALKQAQVSLFKALGGGWSTNVPDSSHADDD